MTEIQGERSLLILPPMLQNDPFYYSREELHRLENLSAEKHEHGLLVVFPWHNWRRVLNNLEMAHIAYVELQQIINILTPDPGSELCIKAKYHSSNLVTYSQAAIELCALWIGEYYKSEIDERRRVFHHRPFRRFLKGLSDEFGEFLDNYMDDINRIHGYRVAWFHKTDGGLESYTAQAPGKNGVVDFSLMVPIDPAMVAETDINKWLELREQSEKKNNGEWLYDIRVFKELIYPIARCIVMDALRITISNPHERRGP